MSRGLVWKLYLTHIADYSQISLADSLAANGYRVIGGDCLSCP